MRRQLRPFHVRVGERVAVPRGGSRLRRSPQDGLAGDRVELQALAGGADQLRAVTAGQPPGHERLGPAAVGGMPADLERAAAVPAVPDCMDTHIEQIHKDHPLTLSGATVTTDHARAAGIRRGRGEGIARHRMPSARAFLRLIRSLTMGADRHDDAVDSSARRVSRRCASQLTAGRQTLAANAQRASPWSSALGALLATLPGPAPPARPMCRQGVRLARAILYRFKTHRMSA